MIPMSVIETHALTRSYRVYHKPEGFGAAFRGLFHRRYETVEAVRGLSLTIECGELVAFLGPNGAGKTTTLKMLSGIIPPTSGNATVLGYVPWQRHHEFRRRFALVMGQKNQLWWDLPAIESFQLFRHIYRIESPRFERNRDQLAEMLGVTRLLERPVRELSLGERMRLELIAALLHDPEVLFLDEPTIGLDVVAQETVRRFLREYQTLRQTTILLTSHYMKDIRDLCERVVIIQFGNIIYDGSQRGLIERFGDHRIVTFRTAEDVPGTVGNTGENQDDATKNPDFTLPVPGVVRLPAATPWIRLRVPATKARDVLARLMQQYFVEDIRIEDPPLESILTELFTGNTEQLTGDIPNT